ncbi:DUF2795 domain-containing protein [Streptomyces tricolor]|nr:DUF2795 domain-containing protein [Streptomyces tricolor]
MTYPADKDRLVSAARQAGASDEVVKALGGMPAEEYTNRADVARSVRVDPDSDLGTDATQRAEQARHGRQAGTLPSICGRSPGPRSRRSSTADHTGPDRLDGPGRRSLASVDMSGQVGQVARR